MKEYFGTLLCVACVCGIAEMLAPNGKNGNIKKQIKFICALTVVCVIALPIGDLLEKLKSESLDLSFIYDRETIESEYESVFIDYVEEYNAITLSESLKSELCKKFDISYDDIDVVAVLITDQEECKIDTVTVYIRKKAIAKDPHLIIDYIKLRTDIECEIIYK